MHTQTQRYTILAALLATKLCRATPHLEVVVLGPRAGADPQTAETPNNFFFSRYGGYVLAGGRVTGYFDKAFRDKAPGTSASAWATGPTWAASLRRSAPPGAPARSATHPPRTERRLSMSSRPTGSSFRTRTMSSPCRLAPA